MKLIKFEDTQLQLKEDTTHEFLLTNKEVAQGYDVKINQLTQARNNHQDELIEGKHWLKLEVATKGGKQKVIHWTKRGIIRLGFFIKSQRAKKFRDFIEDLVIKVDEYKQPHLIENNEQMVEELIKRSDIVRGYQGTIKRLENELAKKQSVILQAQDKQKAINKGIKEAINTRLYDIDTELLKFTNTINTKLSQIDELVNTPLKEDKNFIALGGDAYLPKNGRWKELE